MEMDQRPERKALLKDLEDARLHVCELEDALRGLERLEIRPDVLEAPSAAPSYLEVELQRLIQADSNIMDFLRKGSLDGMWYWDLLEQENEWMSPEFWALFGYESHEKQHKVSEWQNMIYPEDLEVAIANFQKHLADPNHPYDQIVRYYHKDGSTIWVRCRGIAIRDENGLPIRMLGAHNDITSLKKAEQELFESNALLETILDSSFSFIVVKDAASKYIVANKTFSQAVSMSREELINADDYAVFDAKQADIFRERDKLVLAEGHVLIHEDRLRLGDTWYWVLSVRTPLRDEMGKIKGVCVMSTDISTRKRAEEVMIAKERAESANKTKSLFLANMSHEIRTPLNGVISMLQLMQTTGLDHEQGEYISTALDSSRRLTRLLSDILDLSRVEAGVVSLTQDPYDLYEIVDGVTQLFEPIAVQKGLTVRVVIDPATPRRQVGDGLRLQQVLNNLVGNAIKFTESGSIGVEISYLPPRYSRQPRMLLSISDTGIGIPDEMLHGLFDSFAQGETHYKRKFQGAGLGLAIARDLVTMMGGSIAVSSEIGHGTDFHILVPIHPLPGAMKEEGEACLVTKGRLKVLLAEDDFASRLGVMRMLEKIGHDVHAVENGRLALEALSANSYDIVVMDIQMPELDGLDTTRSIRKGEAGDGVKDIPIIAMTAYAMVGDEESFLAAGMNGYLSKPIEFSSLQKALTALVIE